MDIEDTEAIKTSPEDKDVLSNNVRASLAFETFRYLIEGGANIIIIDDQNTSEAFKEQLLENFPYVKYTSVSRSVTLSGSKRIGMLAALSMVKENYKDGKPLPGKGLQPVIAQFEPEKIEIAKHLAEYSQPVSSGEFPVSILNRGGIFNQGGIIEDPLREIQDWDETPDTKGYPGYQAANEARLNEIFTEVGKILGLGNVTKKVADDLLNGSRFIDALDPEALELFFNEFTVASQKELVDPDRYFNAVYAFYLLMLMRDGDLRKLGKVDSLADPFYPPAQRVVEENVDPESFKKKRNMQRETIQMAVRLMAKYLKNEDEASEQRLILENNIFTSSDYFGDHVEAEYNMVKANHGLNGELTLEKTPDDNIVIQLKQKDGTTKTLIKTLNADLSKPKITKDNFPESILRDMLVEVNNDADDNEQAFCIKMLVDILNKQPKYKVIARPMNRNVPGQFRITPELIKPIRTLQTAGLLVLKEVIINRYEISKEDAHKMLEAGKANQMYLSEEQTEELISIEKTGRLRNGQPAYELSNREYNYEV